MKERTIIANLPGDSGYTFMYLAIPLTEKLLEAIKKIKAILQVEQKLISAIIVDGNTMHELCNPKEVYQPSFREEAPLEGEYEIANYALPRGEKAYVSLNISLSTIAITAVDTANDESFGNATEVAFNMEEIL